jgi:RNA polymerase sigma factor (sigma-70 family)
MDESDSQSMYEACAREGTEAQRDAFEQLWRQLYRVAYGMLHSHPDGEALAADCAQIALIKVHRNLAQCRNPASFREWAAQIARRAVLDELRRPDHRRRAALPDDDHQHPAAAEAYAPAEAADLRAALLAIVARGPLSDRSRRVVLGRYFEEQPDEALARVESLLSGRPTLPSHVQVTRAKNLDALRRDEALVRRLRELIE